jgi:hypothetical protein
VDDDQTYLERRFVPSFHLKALGYGQQCPLVPVWTQVTREDSGELRISPIWNNRPLPTEYLLVEPPGFLVLYLAGLDPDPIVESAAVALHGSLRSLLATCGDEVPVQYEKIRTALEVRLYMAQHRWQYSHVVLIGHGGRDGLHLLDEGPIAQESYAELLGCLDGCRATQIISLCCYSGCESMADLLSRESSVTEVVAPDGAFDVRWSTVFVVAYLLKVLDEGYAPERAVRELRFGQPLCIWRNGTRIGCDESTGT